MSVPLDEAVEEILERLWTAREQGEALRSDLSGVALGFDPVPALAEALRRGWVAVEPGRLVLRPAGEARAAGVIRRHRLAERLLFDVVQVDAAAMEAAACELEHSHILSDEATERVCSFLGHPPTCPHERPIPRGPCCERLTREVRPLVTPLSEGTVGGDYRVVFVASRAAGRLDRLCALGVVPGGVVHLHQRRPAFVIRVGGTDVALEPEVAADVFVVPR
jgi:DtxR family Mn-dependent transcriptional regulator